MVTSKGRINKFSEQNNNIVNISKKHESLLDIKKPKFIELNGVLYFIIISCFFRLIRAR